MNRSLITSSSSAQFGGGDALPATPNRPGTGWLTTQAATIG